jgi:hypothetical protein
MKTKLVFHFLLCCQWAPVALSKAYFPGLKEVIANSAVVAIIEGPRSESLGQMGSEGRPKKGALDLRSEEYLTVRRNI